MLGVTPRETPIASSLVASMFTEELRLYCQVLAEISLEILVSLATLTVGEEDNAIYFTREKFVAGLRFHVSLLVNQFLHFTRALPALVHSNVF